MEIFPFRGYLAYNLGTDSISSARCLGCNYNWELTALLMRRSPAESIIR